MKKLSVDDVLMDENQNIMKDVPGYSPFQRIPEEYKSNGSFPGEIQKLLNLNEPEKQNL